MGFLEPHQEKVYAGLRILTGLLFLQHGLQKVFGLFGGPPAEAPPMLIWTAGPIELIGGLLVAIGLFTAPAAFICSGTMAVAYFTAHWVRSAEFFPILNHGEPSILYCWIFFLIAARGAGIWSVDAARGSGT